MPAALNLTFVFFFESTCIAPVKIKLGWKMADHVVDNKMALMRRN
jgi:hypothetical protein